MIPVWGTMLPKAGLRDDMVLMEYYYSCPEYKVMLSARLTGSGRGQARHLI